MNNPELQRQLWLHWRPAQLGWSLALSALILALPLALSSPSERLGNLGMTALLGLWGSALVYGSQLAARSLQEEMQQNTWDWQRLSALTPWQMAWGKLLGATLPAWLYAAVFGLTVLIVSSAWEMLLGHQRGIHLLALALLWGLALQCAAMNAVLLGWQPPAHLAQRTPAPRRSLWLLLSLVLALWSLGRSWNPDSRWLWWGWELGPLGLGYLLGSALLALGLLALWRQLCQQLDVATLPWAWPLGLVLAAGVGAGLLQPYGVDFWSHLTALSLLATALIALQHMPSHARAWRQVQWSWQRSHRRRALQALPLWPVSWLLALLAATCTAGPAAPQGRGWWWGLLCLQLLRDALLLTGFALREHRLRAPRAVFAISWLVLNALLPLLALGLSGFAAASALQPLAVLLDSAPHPDGLAPHLAWLALALQLGAAALWALWGLRRQGAAAPAAPTTAA